MRAWMLLALVACAPIQAPVLRLEPRDGYRLTDLSYTLVPLTKETEERADSLRAVPHIDETDFVEGSHAYLFFVPENENAGKFAFDGDITVFLSDSTAAKLVLGRYYGFYLIINDTLTLTTVRVEGAPTWFVELPRFSRYIGGILYGRRIVRREDFNFDFEVRYMTLDSLVLSDEAREILTDINAECVLAGDC